jgi:hypothetical protein
MNDRSRKGTDAAKKSVPTDIPKRIVYEGSNMRTVYANAVKLSGGKEEIIIQFGINQSLGPSKKEAEVRSIAGVILNPFAAKRLALLLNNALQDYEAENGSLDKELHQPTGKGRGFSSYPSLSKPERTDEKVDFLFKLVNELDVQVGIERSFKIFKRSILADRFLLGFKKDTISGDPCERTLDICKRINMPGKYLKTFRENLPEANIVLFGFEKNETNSLYKAYLEFGGRFEKMIKDNPDLPEPFLIHQGFKWDASDNRICAKAEYTCFPAFSVENMLKRLSDIFYTGKRKNTFKIVEGILRLASKKIGHEEFLYLEVSEEDNPRRSFDINMYRANLLLSELYPFLLDIVKYYSIPDEQFDTLYEPVKSQIFGHLSGGIDRQDRDFFTIYFGVKGSTGTLIDK